MPWMSATMKPRWMLRWPCTPVRQHFGSCPASFPFVSNPAPFFVFCFSSTCHVQCLNGWFVCSVGWLRKLPSPSIQFRPAVRVEPFPGRMMTSAREVLPALRQSVRERVPNMRGLGQSEPVLLLRRVRGVVLAVARQPACGAVSAAGAGQLVWRFGVLRPDHGLQPAGLAAGWLSVAGCGGEKWYSAREDFGMSALALWHLACVRLGIVSPLACVWLQR